MDVVGIIGKADIPVVCSLNRSHPHKIKRSLDDVDEEENDNKVRNWFDDLQAFLHCNLAKKPATVKDLVKWHMPDEFDDDNDDDLKTWLLGRETQTESVSSIVTDLQANLSGYKDHDEKLLFALLKSTLTRAQLLYKRKTYNRYRQLQGWCRAVSRGVFISEDRAKYSWVVRQPNKNKASISSNLIFNNKHNYALIDFNSAAD